MCMEIRQECRMVDKTKQHHKLNHPLHDGQIKGYADTEDVLDKQQDRSVRPTSTSHATQRMTS